MSPPPLPPLSAFLASLPLSDSEQALLAHHKQEQHDKGGREATHSAAADSSSASSSSSPPATATAASQSPSLSSSVSVAVDGQQLERMMAQMDKLLNVAEQCKRMDEEQATAVLEHLKQDGQYKSPTPQSPAPPTASSAVVPASAFPTSSSPSSPRPPPRTPHSLTSTPSSLSASPLSLPSGLLTGAGMDRSPFLTPSRHGVGSSRRATSDTVAASAPNGNTSFASHASQALSQDVVAKATASPSAPLSTYDSLASPTLDSLDAALQSVLQRREQQLLDLQQEFQLDSSSTSSSFASSAAPASSSSLSSAHTLPLPSRPYPLVAAARHSQWDADEKFDEHKGEVQPESAWQPATPQQLHDGRVAGASPSPSPSAALTSHSYRFAASPLRSTTTTPSRARARHHGATDVRQSPLRAVLPGSRSPMGRSLFPNEASSSSFQSPVHPPFSSASAAATPAASSSSLFPPKSSSSTSAVGAAPFYPSPSYASTIVSSSLASSYVISPERSGSSEEDEDASVVVPAAAAANGLNDSITSVMSSNSTSTLPSLPSLSPPGSLTGSLDHSDRALQRYLLEVQQELGRLHEEVATERAAKRAMEQRIEALTTAFLLNAESDEEAGEQSREEVTEEEAAVGPGYGEEREQDNASSDSVAAPSSPFLPPSTPDAALVARTLSQLESTESALDSAHEVLQSMRLTLSQKEARIEELQREAALLNVRIEAERVAREEAAKKIEQLQEQQQEARKEHKKTTKKLKAETKAREQAQQEVEQLQQRLAEVEALESEWRAKAAAQANEARQAHELTAEEVAEHARTRERLSSLQAEYAELQRRLSELENQPPPQADSNEIEEAWNKGKNSGWEEAEKVAQQKHQEMEAEQLRQMEQARLEAEERMKQLEEQRAAELEELRTQSAVQLSAREEELKTLAASEREEATRAAHFTGYEEGFAAGSADAATRSSADWQSKLAEQLQQADEASRREFERGFAEGFEAASAEKQGEVDTLQQQLDSLATTAARILGQEGEEGEALAAATLEEKRSAAQRLEEHLHTLSQALEDAEEHIQNLTVELDRQTEELERAQKQHEEEKEMRAAAEEANASLQWQLAEHEQAQSLVSHDEISIRTDPEAAPAPVPDPTTEEELASARQELQELRASLEEMRQAWQLATEQLENTRALLKAREEEWGAEKREMGQRVAQLERQVADKDEMLLAAQRQAAEATAALATASSSSSSTALTPSSSSSSSSSLTAPSVSQILHLKQHIVSLQSKLDHTEISLRCAQLECETLTRQMHELRQDLSDPASVGIMLGWGSQVGSLLGLGSNWSLLEGLFAAQLGLVGLLVLWGNTSLGEHVQEGVAYLMQLMFGEQEESAQVYGYHMYG